MAKKILLAEDSVTMQRVIEMTFAGEDYDVVTARNVDEALNKAAQVRPDIVIADLSLSGRDGYDLCHSVKANHQGTPVLLMHGSASNFDPARAQQVGADADLSKPFDTQTLIDKVRSLSLSHSATPLKPRLQSLSQPFSTIAPGPSSIAPGGPEMPSPQAASPVAKARPSSVSDTHTYGREGTLIGRLGSLGASSPPRSARPLVGDRSAAPQAEKTHGTRHEVTIEAAPPPAGAHSVLPSFEAVAAPVQPAAPASVPIQQVKAEALSSSSTSALGGASALPIGGGSPAADSNQKAAHEAIRTLSRDVIERIAWEVIPDLAEVIIKEQVERLIEARKAEVKH